MLVGSWKVPEKSFMEIVTKTAGTLSWNLDGEEPDVEKLTVSVVANMLIYC